MEIDQVREKISNIGLIVLAIVTIPALAASLGRIPSLGWQPVMLLHIIVVSLVILLTIFRHSFSVNTRSLFIVMAIFIVGAGEIFNFGILGSGWPYLVHASIIAALLLDFKRSIITFALSSFVIMAGLIANQQLIALPHDVSIHAQEASTWANAYSDFLLIYSTTIAAFYFLNSALLKSKQKLKETNENLEIRIKERTLELSDANMRLSKMLEEIKTLQGIIPICSYCKQIRDDQGAWARLEDYLSQHSEAEFSHGICPTCYDRQMEGLKKS